MNGRCDDRRHGCEVAPSPANYQRLIAGSHYERKVVGPRYFVERAIAQRQRVRLTVPLVVLVSFRLVPRPACL